MSTDASLEILRLAAFSTGDAGGNPAGVVLADTLPSDADMQRIAAEVGYSETAFAAPDGDGWRVRYFAPLSEVAFCGHATVALGAVLADRHGPGTFSLQLNDAAISVEGGGGRAALISPPTRSALASDDLVANALELFRLAPVDLDPALAPALAHAGNDHLILALRHRITLAGMAYDLGAGADLMRRHGLTTISLLWIETPRRFHARNAFAVGGVAEDPATGAAAAALAGFLRDIDWPHEGGIEILQGEDMGLPSHLKVGIGDTKGSGIRVEGTVRDLALDPEDARPAGAT